MEPTVNPGRLRDWLRLAEFLLLFFVLPTAAAMLGLQRMVFPLLWSAAGVCLFLLLRDPTFDRSVLWNRRAMAAGWRIVCIRWLLAATALGAIVWSAQPERFLSFPRRNPGFWAIVMLAYPVLSVLPQNLIYRVFLLHRYAKVFRASSPGGTAKGPVPAGLMLASAWAFCYGHVLFQNWVALVLTFAGGLLFAWTYLRSRSMGLCALEHALYGDAVFTIGLGTFLYAGAVGR